MKWGICQWFLNPYFDIRLAGSLAFLGSGFKDIARLADCNPRTAGVQACDGNNLALKGESASGRASKEGFNRYVIASQPISLSRKVVSATTDLGLVPTLYSCSRRESRRCPLLTHKFRILFMGELLSSSLHRQLPVSNMSAR